MERTVSRRRAVRVGSLVEEKFRRFALTAEQSHDQGAGAIRRGVVDVGAGVQEQFGRGRVAGPGGEQQRRVPALIDFKHALLLLAFGVRRRKAAGHRDMTDAGAGLDVGAALDQRAHGIRLSLGGGPHQGALLVGAFTGIDLGPPRQQCAHRVRIACACAGHQRRHPRGQGRLVGVGAGRQQRLDHGGVAVLTGQGEGRHAVFVRRVRVRASRQKRPHGRQIVQIGRPMQRRCAIRLRRIDLGALFQQGLDRGRVLPSDRVDQWRVNRRAGGGRPQAENQRADCPGG